MQLQQPQCSNATHGGQTQLESRAGIWWKQVEHLQTRTIWSLHWRGQEGGSGGVGGPHLEPSSLPFLSNSVETLRCIRQEDKENKIDVDCTFLLQLFWFKQKMRRRRETTTENKTTEKHQEVKESASGEEKWWSQTMNSNQWNAADGPRFSEDGTIKAPFLVSLSEQQHPLRVFLRSSEEPTDPKNSSSEGKKAVLRVYLSVSSGHSLMCAQLQQVAEAAFTPKGFCCPLVAFPWRPELPGSNRATHGGPAWSLWAVFSVLALTGMNLSCLLMRAGEPSFYLWFLITVKTRNKRDKTPVPEPAPALC